MAKLEVLEGLQHQSANEEIAYAITTTPWGSSPSNIVVTAYDEEYSDADVTATVFPTNTPSALGDVITLSKLKALTKDHTYRIEVKFTSGTNIFECFFRVRCLI